MSTITVLIPAIIKGAHCMNMKKLILSLISTSVIIAMTIPASAKSGDWWSKEWFNENIENISRSKAKNGAGYIDIQDFAGYINGTYTYDKDTKRVTIRQKEKELFTFSLEATDNSYVKLMLNPMEKDGRIVLLTDIQRLKSLVDKYVKDGKKSMGLRSVQGKNQIQSTAIPPRSHKSKDGYTFTEETTALDSSRKIKVVGDRQDLQYDARRVEQEIMRQSVTTKGTSADSYITPEYNIIYNSKGYAQIVLCNYKDYDETYGIRALCISDEYCNTGVEIKDGLGYPARLDEWKGIQEVQKKDGIVYTVKPSYALDGASRKITEEDTFTFTVFLSQNGAVVSADVLEVPAKLPEIK